MTTRTDTIKRSNSEVRKMVLHYLRSKTPSGYSFEVPADGVMYVSDGVGQQHERWYVVVQAKPESVVNTRTAEVQRIWSEVEQDITRHLKRTVYLMSALPVI